jgi:hypothetical protein
VAAVLTSEGEKDEVGDWIIQGWPHQFHPLIAWWSPSAWTRWFCNCLKQENAEEWCFATENASSYKVIRLPPASLSTLWTHPPCCEEAQTTERGHIEVCPRQQRLWVSVNH